MEAARFGSSQFTTISGSTSSRRRPPLKLHRNNITFKSPLKFSVRASAVEGDDSAVTLLDYGAGNVQSIRNAIRYLGLDIKDVETPEDILNAKRLIVPGVGAFAAMMDVLNNNGMAEALCSYIENDRPFLGICLGLQLLFESSEENGPEEACLLQLMVRNLGKPVELAGQYYLDGADEVSFLNITGFRDFPLGDLPMLQILKYTSENVFVPLTVGGGIRDFTDGNGRYYSSLEVASEYFRSGADKAGYSHVSTIRYYVKEIFCNLFSLISLISFCNFCCCSFVILFENVFVKMF
ncbi:imidazole glycerol phosphate synthase hisHF, chloroplastic [Lactuca sativa]|uniref:Glutamine amidotransferase domain-containing protein n=1 Tax=Lactuca sativa TaxID=4236 RepID=A0A9R1W5G8_LACSA|nr:imidazole glycerol phosphate synthase hisHF, chloroplastic [Lactuca sativa]KAJ0217473.1 hypothetical protein LSAT_V11C300102270 [Lactuca sativa]